MTAIERDVNLSDDVLRVLITEADHLNQQEMEAVEPQPIHRAKSGPVGSALWRGSRPAR